MFSTSQKKNLYPKTRKIMLDLLDENQIRAGESLALRMGACEMHSIVSMTLKDLSATCGDRFLLEIAREKMNGYWNDESVRRVIENLINNAIKYGRAQELITIKLTQINECIEIAVHNLGNSISASDQSILFQPFHRQVFEDHL